MMYQLVACSLQLVATIRKHLSPLLLPATGFQLPASQRGFTILLAALVASLVLTLGMSIFSIAQKQVVLSSLGRSSQYAFYAADTAAECALYWDSRFQLFSASSSIGEASPTCGGITLETDPALADIPNNPPYIVSFELRNMFQSAQYGGNCARVVVNKNVTNPQTVIHADGFSTSCEEIESSSRSLQRSVELRY